jgi:hypothetical protein
MADSSMGDLGRSPTMGKKCEPLNERSYDVKIHKRTKYNKINKKNRTMNKIK